MWTRTQYILAVTAIAVVIQTGTALAGLTGPPSSSVRPLADGKHMVVRLSPAPLQNDEGRISTLPDGRVVDLRATYPASGSYEIGSDKPIWTAPWNGEDGWTVSDDGRYLVRWNYRARGTFDFWIGELDWLVKFYDQGREIRSYGGSELIDFPRLLPFESDGYHFFDDVRNLKIIDNEFFLDTTTHESYVFDIRTGKILRERRTWRVVARIAWTSVALATGCFAWLAWHRRRARRHVPLGQPALDIPSSIPQRPLKPGVRYSLRSLVFAAPSVIVLCIAFCWWPHVLIFVTSVAAMLWLVYLAVRYRRESCGAQMTSTKRAVSVGARFSAALAAAVICYVLSMGPVVRVIDRLHAPDDVRFAILLTVYRPFIWAPEFPRGIPALQWYYGKWGLR